MTDKLGRTLTWLLPLVSLAVSLTVFWIQENRCSHFEKRIEEVRQQIQRQTEINQKLGLPNSANNRGFAFIR
jgi:hypothetical protein